MSDTYADAYSDVSRLTAGAGPGYVGSPGQAGNTAFLQNVVVPLTSGVPVGHTLVLAVAHSSQAAGVTKFTVADSKGNSWAVDADIDAGTSRGVTHWSAPITVAMVAGDTVTATLTAGLAAEKMAAVLIELDQTVAVDGAATGQTTNVQTALSASVTAAAAGTLLISAAASGSGTTITPDASLTAGPTAVTVVSAPDARITTAYKTLAAAGAATAGWTLSAGAVAACSAVAYKPAGVAPPPTLFQAANGTLVPISEWRLVGGVLV